MEGHRQRHRVSYYAVGPGDAADGLFSERPTRLHAHRCAMRYWLSPGTPPALDSDGFFRDPRRYRRPSGAAQTDACRLDRLAEVPCLILLGEGGIGKSTELEREHDRVVGLGHTALYVRLGSLVGAQLDRRLLAHPDVLAWKAHGRPLALFLDALDEAPASLRLWSLLRDDLLSVAPQDQAQRASALRLCITCRAGLWPDALGQTLRAFWGKGQVQTRSLAPLSQADVARAAEHRGLDGDAFLRDLRAVGGGAWAALPLSLNWLLDAAEGEGGLPQTRLELYGDACRHLCTEQNPDRLALQKTPDVPPLLDAEVRRVVAARLALLMRFGGRTAVWTGPAHRAAPEDLLAHDAVGLDRAPGGGDLAVSLRDVAEVVEHTGLFRSDGDGRARWVHESIPDFLAAWALHHQGVGARRAGPLLCDPHDGHVVPQLHAVAAWAATLDPELADQISERDPAVAAAGDPQALPAAAREALVERLLVAHDEGRTHPYDDAVPRLHALDHPGLPEQLRRWVVDRSRRPHARYEAIGIANLCRLTALVPDFLSVALDADDDPWIRATAVRAVARLAPPESLAVLKPLALGAPGDDPDASVTSAARAELWPAHLSFADLLVSLDADAYEQTVDGSHTLSRFHFGLSDGIAPDQLLDGLRWAAGETPPRLDSLVEGLAELGLHHAADAQIAGALADLLVVEIGEKAGGRLTDLRYTPAARDAGDGIVLLKAVVRRAAASDEDDALFRVVRQFRLVSLADAAWLPAWTCTLAGAERASAVRLTAEIFRTDAMPPDALQLAYDAVAAAPAPDLHWAVVEVIAPWRTDDRRAESFRGAFGGSEPSPPELVDPEVTSRVADALPDASQGIQGRWIAVFWALRLRPTPRKQHDRGSWKAEHVGPHHDLTALASWSDMSAPLRARVVEAAAAYLSHVRPDASDWEVFEGGEEQTYRVLTALPAFVLLDSLAPERLEVLPDDAWAAWLPAFLLLPHRDDDRLDRLLARAARAADGAAPPLARRALTAASQFQSRSLDLAGALLRLGRADLADAVVAFARSGHVRDGERAALWSLLGEQDVPEAVVHYRALALDADPCTAADAVAARLDVGDGSLWAAVAERFASDDAFARALFAALARVSHRQSPLRALAEDALISLEERLHALVPVAGTAPSGDGASFGPVDDDASLVRSIRYSVRNELVMRGTREAEDALRTLHARLGDDEYARRASDAATKRRAAEFVPLSPVAVLRLAGQDDQRLVRSADELFDAVVEALQDFERWLRLDLPPRVFDLWNALPVSDALALAAAHAAAAGDTATVRGLAALRVGAGSTQHVPKDEGSLSDLVQRFLHGRLSPRRIVSHREVEVLKGHSPDLVVETLPEGAAVPVRVMVEVKASWHRDVQTAMASQLADGYLARSGTAHGVYLVGWYGTERWDSPPTGWPSDKRSRAARQTLSVLTDHLAHQAAVLSAAGPRLAALVVDASLPPPRAS